MACGDMLELLEFVDAALDKVAFSLFAFAERDFIMPVRFGRNDKGADHDYR
jgi:hypothetical protein